MWENFFHYSCRQYIILKLSYFWPTQNLFEYDFSVISISTPCNTLIIVTLSVMFWISCSLTSASVKSCSAVGSRKLSFEVLSPKKLLSLGQMFHHLYFLLLKLNFLLLISSFEDLHCTGFCTILCPPEVSTMTRSLLVTINSRVIHSIALHIFSIVD